MDSGFSNENVVQIIGGGAGDGNVENWGSGVDQAVWATEDEYGMWDREGSLDTNSNLNLDGNQSQIRLGDEPFNKKSRNAQSGDNRSKAIGKMFFKTKLCCKFRVGTCPYISNCNFAHSIEELRQPPPNWQEIVAAHEEERGVSAEPREEHQIPSLGSSSFVVDSQRSNKGRHCKKFYTKEGCPYGDSCTFLHDEQSKARESVAISLVSGSSGGYGSGGGANVGGTTPTGTIVANSSFKPSNWKTRFCKKWEHTGYCSFGSKCNFAHGAAELQRYGGGRMDTDPKQGPLPFETPSDTMITGATAGPHSNNYHIGVPSQKVPNIIPKTGRRPNEKWKGPDKISLIYGDWPEPLE